MGRQDNSNATSGLAPVADAVATGGPSSAIHRAPGRRDALVPFCIVIVSAAFSMMLFEQFGLSLPASVVAGAVAWTAFMLLHKQVQKSAQIAHLKAELARTRTAGAKPRNAGTRGAAMSPLEAAATTAIDTRGPDLASQHQLPQSGLPQARMPELGVPQPSLSVPGSTLLNSSSRDDAGLERSFAAELRAAIASPSASDQEFDASRNSEAATSIDLTGTRLPPAAPRGPSLIAVVPGENAPSAGRSEAARDQWSFRPRSETHGNAGTPGLQRTTTIEGDLELVQRKIKEMADEVNSTEASRAAKQQRSDTRAKSTTDAIEHSIGALKAAAGTMRDRPSSNAYVPTLEMPAFQTPPAAKPAAPQGFGELVIPASAQRIAGSGAGAPKATVGTPKLELPRLDLPDFPLVDFSSGPAAAPAMPPRTAGIARAVEDNAMDVFLAPIVTLSTHSVSHYEMTVGLKSPNGERLEFREEEFAGLGGELEARFDIARLNRAAALSLRMEARDKDGSLLTEVMGTSLINRAFLEAFARVYEARPRIASQVVLMLSQRSVDQFTPAAWQAVRDMHAFGFRFALDKIQHAATDFAAVAKDGFRFIRLDTRALLEGVAARDRFVPAAEIHQRASLAALSIVADGIVDAATQKRLLEAGILLGQGSLFGAARQVTLDGSGPASRSAAA